MAVDWCKGSGGTFLAVQWLGLCASSALGTGSIPGGGTKIPQPKKKKKGSWVRAEGYFHIKANFLLFNNVCLQSPISEFEVSPAHHLRAPMLVLKVNTVLSEAIQCLLHSPVFHFCMCSPHWNRAAQSLTRKIPPPNSGDSALTLDWKSASMMWMKLFKRLNAITRANSESVCYLNKNWDTLVFSQTSCFCWFFSFLNLSLLFISMLQNRH